VIDEILVADLDAPRKQQHTATRIFDRLVDEHGMVDISYPVVRVYVAGRRREVRAEHGRGEPGAFIPQTHLPGREAEVEFGEVAIRLRGELETLFSLRMPRATTPAADRGNGDRRADLRPGRVRPGRRR
jgi:hypothetical protein